MGLEMEKRKVAVALFLVVIMAVAFYFAGVFTETIPRIKGPAGFIEPQFWGSAQSPFLVKNLSIQPKKVQPNEVVTIIVSVTNTHDTWGIYSLVLNINGAKEAETQANVDAGATEYVSFEVTRKEPGRYSVFINGLSDSFTVVTPSD